MPVHKSWTPPIKITAHIKDGYPIALSPKIKVFITITKIKKNATAHKIKPSIEDTAKGAAEKPIIPSKAYQNSPQKDQDVFPATLSTFS